MTTTDQITIEPGDVYCPRCLDPRLSMTVQGDQIVWTCERRCGPIQLPFTVDPQGRFAWQWNDDCPRPNPGCPWCGSCNITITTDGNWSCQRRSCRRMWRALWVRRDEDWRTDRWLIRYPVEQVTWVFGTVADLECWRRRWDGFEPGVDQYHYSCCRFPKVLQRLRRRAHPWSWTPTSLGTDRARCR